MPNWYYDYHYYHHYYYHFYNYHYHYYICLSNGHNQIYLPTRAKAKNFKCLILNGNISPENMDMDMMVLKV